MAKLSNKDPLCRQYADAMGFFERNALMLDERIKELKAQDGDTAELMQAKQRLMCAKEGAGRMLSDRMVSMDSAVVDPDSTLLALSKMQAGMQDGEERKQISNAITLIVRQRERLTNTDRGRRALQRKLGEQKKVNGQLSRENENMQTWGRNLVATTQNMIDERAKMLDDHAKHHCEERMCNGCPYNKFCCDPKTAQEIRERRWMEMHKKLINHNE